MAVVMPHDRVCQNLECENCQLFEPLPKQNKADLSTFEDLILKVPHLGEAIVR